MLFIIIYLTIGMIDLVASYTLIRILFKIIKEERTLDVFTFGMVVIAKLFLWPIDITYMGYQLYKVLSPKTREEAVAEKLEEYEMLFD